MKRILSVILLIGPLHSFAIDCRLNAILSHNSNFFPKDQAVLEPIKGQGAMINPYFVQTVDPNAEIERPARRRARLLETVTPRSEQELEAIIRDVKEILMRSIGPTQELMLKRIQDMKVVVSDCHGAEASNDNTNYTISLCTNARKMPKLALVSLLAHEFGHSLDLCSLAGVRYQNAKSINLSAINNSISGDGLEDSFASMSRAEYFLDNASMESSEARTRFLEVIKRSELRISDSGIPLEHNPVRPTYECLSQTQAGYAQMPENREEACRNDSYKETSAQVWAARVTANYVTAFPPADTTERLGLFANSLEGVNTNKGLGRKAIDMEMIYFSEPAIRNLFECSPAPEQNCSSSFHPERDFNLVQELKNFMDFQNETTLFECR